MDKEEVITLVRSIISSTPAPLKISQINNDFKKHTGINIPLFEYKNLVEFFQSIPQTVKLTGNPIDYQVGLVFSKKSAHIVSLVEKQKKNSNKPTKFDSFKYVKPCSLTLRKLENSFQQDNSFLNISSKNYKKNLLDYLNNCPNGANFNDIKKYIPQLEDWNGSLKINNITSLIKMLPFCVFYNNKFYSEEVFKKLILDNKLDENAEAK